MNTINKVIFLRRTRELFFLWTIRAQRAHTTSTPNNKWMNKKLTKEVKRYKNSKNTRSNSFSFPCVSSTTIRLNDFCWPQWTFVIVSNRFCAYRRLMAREPDTIHMNEQKKERKKGQRGKIEREFDKWERERLAFLFMNQPLLFESILILGSVQTKLEFGILCRIVYQWNITVSNDNFARSLQ